MLKYQLMGRKKVVKPRLHTKYPLLHLHSLPYEILLQIFGYVDDLTGLLSLVLTCSKFNNIISKTFLYRTIQFQSTSQFLRFALAHLPLKTSRRFGLNEPSAAINYIRSVHFVNPPTNDSAATLTLIAGTYTVDSILNDGVLQYNNFITHLKSLLNEAYGLKEVKISEISPQFEFPPEFLVPPSSLKLKFKTSKPTRSLERLVLTAQSGWNFPFKVSHISLFLYVFDEISELKLNNFVISESRLLSDTLSKPFTVGCLVLHGCIYADSKKKEKRVSTDIFGRTTSLLLEDIQSGSDLSLIDCIKLNDKLFRLSLDISSKIFYWVDPEDKTKKFNFARFNNFFKLVCSGQGGYCNLKELVLTNFDLFHSYTHQHDKLDAIQEEEDSWVEPPTNTFEVFLDNLSRVPFLTIVVKDAPKVMHTCVNCGFKVEEEETKSIGSLLPHEWAIILAPLFNNDNCSVLIYDHELRPLFSRKTIT